MGVEEPELVEPSAPAGMGVQEGCLCTPRGRPGGVFGVGESGCVTAPAMRGESPVSSKHSGARAGELRMLGDELVEHEAPECLLFGEVDW